VVVEPTVAVVAPLATLAVIVARVAPAEYSIVSPAKITQVGALHGPDRVIVVPEMDIVSP
jgi:hypothetical protein